MTDERTEELEFPFSPALRDVMQSAAAAHIQLPGMAAYLAGFEVGLHLSQMDPPLAKQVLEEMGRYIKTMDAGWEDSGQKLAMDVISAARGQGTSVS